MSIPMLPTLPEIKKLPHPMPDEFIYSNEDGYYFATANFNAPNPIWKKYKRLGWAKRYINKTRNESHLDS